MNEAKYILAAQLDKVERHYFDYLTVKSDALDEVVSYFIALKRNTQTIEAFGYVQEKESELTSLFDLYYPKRAYRPQTAQAVQHPFVLPLFS